MTWLFAVLIVLALGGVAVVASGRYGGAMPPTWDDRPDVGLPDGPLRGADLRRARFPLALRGYRMEEVDDLIARLADQLDAAGPPPQDGPGDGNGPDGRGGSDSP